MSAPNDPRREDDAKISPAFSFLDPDAPAYDELRDTAPASDPAAADTELTAGPTGPAAAEPAAEPVATSAQGALPLTGEPTPAQRREAERLQAEADEAAFGAAGATNAGDLSAGPVEGSPAEKKSGMSPALAAILALILGLGIGAAAAWFIFDDSRVSFDGDAVIVDVDPGQVTVLPDGTVTGDVATAADLTRPDAEPDPGAGLPEDTGRGLDPEPEFEQAPGEEGAPEDPLMVPETAPAAADPNLAF